MTRYDLSPGDLYVTDDSGWSERIGTTSGYFVISCEKISETRRQIVILCCWSSIAPAYEGKISLMFVTRKSTNDDGELIRIFREQGENDELR